MSTVVNLYSTKKGEITRFLNKFLEKEINLSDDLKWEKKYENPVEIADIIGGLIDNNEEYMINMWISLDEGFFINVNYNNADQIIRYLYERFPY